MESCFQFPPELEREIFETSALLYPNTVPSLLLVAHRVLEWIEPLLYRVICLNTSTKDSILIPLRSKSADFFRKNVHHVLVDLGDEDNVSVVGELLELAVEIRSLSFSSSPVNSWVLHGKSIKPLVLLSRLSVPLQVTMGPIDPQFPVYASITHLDLFDHVFTPTFWLELGLLPALTHLAVSTVFPAVPVQSMQVLVICKKLLILVLMDPDGERPFDDEPVVDDDRCVLMGLTNEEYKDDWIRGARGGVDFWARAEKFVDKKRRGEIEPKSRRWIIPEDGI